MVLRGELSELDRTERKRSKTDVAAWKLMTMKCSLDGEPQGLIGGK